MARLQRAVRPSAGYARSLTVLARAKDAGLTTKSGIILGMGERMDEVLATLADLRAVGTDIVTVGQYLRPSAHHLPVARWWTPEEFDAHRRRRAWPWGSPTSRRRRSPGRAITPGRPSRRRPPGERATDGPGPDRAGRRRRSQAPTEPMTVLSDAARPPATQRIDRVRQRMVETGVDALLLSHGADLPWLTGYRAMPLERLTMLVLPVDRGRRPGRPRPGGAQGGRRRPTSSPCGRGPTPRTRSIW